MRWLALWIVLGAVYLLVDLPLRALTGEGWPPGAATLLAVAVIPALQLGAVRFVHWMRRSVRNRPQV